MSSILDWPFLASLWETEALLQGRMVQARRFPTSTWHKIAEAFQTPDTDVYLWVRESGYRIRDKTVFIYEVQPDADALLGRTEGQDSAEPPRDFAGQVARVDLPEMEPPIKCPRYASRLTLKLTGIELVNLQTITQRDINELGIITAKGEFDFPEQWDANHQEAGKTWADDPEVYALRFDVHHRNIGPKGD